VRHHGPDQFVRIRQSPAPYDGSGAGILTLYQARGGIGRICYRRAGLVRCSGFRAQTLSLSEPTS